MKKFGFPLIICTILFACGSPETPVEVSEASIREHIKVLASDDFQGRKPFTAGEEKTLAYLTEQLTKLGIEPGNGDSYFQDVPMVELTATPSAKMVIGGGANPLELSVSSEFVAYTERVVDSVKLENSELVFAGYGVVAPEYGWNDYAGLDVKGKTVIVLVNDPGFGSGDSTLFKGETMTYYGRWTYKYEEAARQGAAGS